MVDKKISDYSAASALAGTDLIEVVQSGDNFKTTPAAIGTYVLSLAALAELIRDTIGTAATAGTGVTITVNDAGDTITFAADGTAVTALTAASASDGSELIHAVQGGNDRKMTVAQIKTWALNGLTQANVALLTTASTPTFLGVTLTGGTVTTSAPVWNATQTWNASGVTFNGLLLNVTNTASAAASTLMDLQVGGTSMFSVLKTGWLTGPVDADMFGGATTTFNSYLRIAGSIFGLGTTASCTALWEFSNQNVAVLCASGQHCWSSSAGDTSPVTLRTNIDLRLARDAANVLAQRNTTNAQTHRWYRSYTDASNYSRISLGWNTTTALFQTEGAGTGARSNLAFGVAALATNATLGYVMIPSCAGAPTGVPADIPTGQVALHYDSTNNKIYAYNGAWRSILVA